jgi:hypothetical protein
MSTAAGLVGKGAAGTPNGRARATSWPRARHAHRRPSQRCEAGENRERPIVPRPFPCIHIIRQRLVVSATLCWSRRAPVAGSAGAALSDDGCFVRWAAATQDWSRGRCGANCRNAGDGGAAISTVAPAVASPLGQLEPEERATVIRTLREHLPPAAFDAVLAALAAGLDEGAALPSAVQDRDETLLLDAFDGALGAVVVSTLGITTTPSDAWLPRLRALRRPGRRRRDRRVPGDAARAAASPPE